MSTTTSQSLSTNGQVWSTLRAVLDLNFLQLLTRDPVRTKYLRGILPLRRYGDPEIHGRWSVEEWWYWSGGGNRAGRDQHGFIHWHVQKWIKKLVGGLILVISPPPLVIPPLFVKVDLARSGFSGRLEILRHLGPFRDDGWAPPQTRNFGHFWTIFHWQKCSRTCTRYLNASLLLDKFMVNAKGSVTVSKWTNHDVLHNKPPPYIWELNVVMFSSKFHGFGTLKR